MRVVIAGGHGKIALRLEKLLTEQGHQAVGLIRSEQQIGDVTATGAVAELCDLEKASVEDVTATLTDADAVVFAAGAGPGSGAERKKTVDRDAAILLAHAAIAAGVERYVMVSAMGADAPPTPDTEPVFAAYLRAKTEADEYLMSCEDLRWTILRPGGLTEEPGTGTVALAEHTGRGSIPRDDVAAVLAALLVDSRTAGLTLELIAGTTAIRQAVEAVTG